MNTKTHYIFTAILMQLLAITYIYVIDLRIVQAGELVWDSQLGYILLIPFFTLVGYGWLLIMLSIFHKPQVLTEEADWKAKAVHWTDLHNTTSVHLLDKHPNMGL